MPIVERWCPSSSCCDPVWEAAYRRFESPEEEIRKFQTGSSLSAPITGDVTPPSSMSAAAVATVFAH